MSRLKIVATAVLAGFTLLVGCKKITVTTRIHPDGSIERVLSTTGDSSGVSSSGFPLPEDTSWYTTSLPDSSDSSKYRWTFSKKYANTKELNRDFGKKGSELMITSQSILNTKFRWFYSYYRFQETIQPLGPMLIFPDSSTRFIYEAKRDSLEDIEKWEDELIFESFFQTILKQVKDNPGYGLTADIVQAHRQELRNTTDEMDIMEESFVKDMLQLCFRIFRNEAVYFWKPALEEYWNRAQLYLDYIERSIGEDYEYIVVMPGQIIDTNAEKISKTRLIWTVDSEEFEFDPVPMWAESRRLNVFPVVLTLLFVLGGGALVIYLTAWEKIQARRLNRKRPRWVMNKWLSIAMLSGGILTFSLGMMLILTMWSWKMVLFEVISWRDRLVFLSITVVGLALLIFGALQLFKRRRISGRS